jgi:hypothetical protein
MQSTNILLDESDFNKLTSGEILVKDTTLGQVKIILSDIGYWRMINILEEKENALQVKRWEESDDTLNFFDKPNER